MSSNPDEIYWANAAKDPVAPATLWLYPKLRYFERSIQRSALQAARSNAMRHWLSHVLRWVGLATALVQVYAMLSGHSELRRIFVYAFPAAMLAWLIHLQFATRMELRRAITLEMRRAVDG